MRLLRLLLFATFVLLAGAQRAGAQDTLTPGAALTVTTGDAPVLLTYRAPDVQRVTLTARGSAPDAVDVTLEVRDAQARTLAYSDDAGVLHADADDLAPTDARLTLTLPAGAYTIVVDSFNGVSVGTVDVLLSVEPPAAMLTPPFAVPLPLPRRGSAALTFNGTAGTVLMLTARDTSGTLDPALDVLDGDGRVLATSDDHAGTDWALDVLDARLTLTLPADGVYTVRVRDLRGRGGTAQVSAALVPAP